MKIAFAILAHERPELLARLLKQILGDGDLAVLHWDRESGGDLQSELEKLLPPELAGRIQYAERHAVRWGEWSVVEAALSCLRALRASGETADYIVHLSGSDYPIRPLGHLKQFLGRSRKELIECHRPEDNWVVHGMQEERYVYRHWTSWRRSPKWMMRAMHLQRALGLKRRLPDGVAPYLGSQWWALTWDTAMRALEFSGRPRIRRFFRTVAVPDEMFFQSFVGTHIPRDRIAMTGPTFYQFSPEGRALVFYNDHAWHLTRQRCFFARKLSPQADRLRDELDLHCRKLARAELEFDMIARDTSGYDRLVALHSEGLPNRRIMGGARSETSHDLEWNRLLYIVLMAPPGMDIEPLRAALNANPSMLCMGDLFAPDRIDYADEPHPCYTANAIALRDRAPANFLCDVIHYNRNKTIGFSLRTSHSAEMQFIIASDPNARVVVCGPAQRADGGKSAFTWHAGSTRRETENLVNTLAKATNPDGSVPVERTALHAESAG